MSRWPIAAGWLFGDPAAMNLTLILLVPASVATDLTPPVNPAAVPVAAVTTYDAMVATEETPVARQLTKPAVFIEDSAAKAIVSASRRHSIA